MNIHKTVIYSLYFGTISILVLSCMNVDSEKSLESSPTTENTIKKENTVSKEAFLKTFEKHLKALENKDLEALKSTLSSTDQLYLTLPDGKMSSTVTDFIAMHQQWFKETGWTMEHEILKSENDENFGYVLVKAIYREENRNGKPYMHEMFVSYDLKNESGKWVVVKDHASTIKKDPVSS